MNENERMDFSEGNDALKEVLEETAQAEEIPEEACEEIPEGISDEPYEELPEEAVETAAVKQKIGAGGILAIIGVVLLAAAALLPAWWNTRLAAPAVKGMVLETARRGIGAAGAYNELLTLEQEVALWSEENFSFGEGPAFSTGNFALERFVPLIYDLDGLLTAYEAASQYLQEGAPMPLRVRKLLERMEPLSEINDNIGANLDPAINEVDPTTGQPTHDEAAQAQFLLKATQEARAKDKAKERKLLYDTIELNFAASLDLQSDNVGQMLAALKKAAGSEPWMYENVELKRAQEMENYAVMAEGFTRRAERVRDDSDAIVGQAKALYLSGDKAGADKLIKKYSCGATEGYMAALQAELLLREEKYGEAIAVCDKMIAKGKPLGESSTPSVWGNGIMEAVAQKGAALMLQGKAKEALDLLSKTMEAPYGQTGAGYLCAIAAAAVLAEDTETAQSLVMMGQQNNFSLPADIFGVEMTISPEGALAMDVTLLKTIEEVYTEGWGGF